MRRLQYARAAAKFLGALGFIAILGGAISSGAQGVGVPVYQQDAATETQLKAAADKARAAGKLVRETKLTNQFDRTSCNLQLSTPRDARLPGRDLWATARAAHLRVGWYYFCTKCDQWHLNLGAGYALTPDGALATCFHVVDVPDNLKEGYLIAADEGGRIYPVTEILAANAEADACVVRINAKDLKPLPLNTNVFPGDRCVCFSDPLGQRGYYTDGIVSRFLNRMPSRKKSDAVTRLDVTTDWAPGSSGAAILDECGNAIGHVTSISTLSNRGTRRAAGPTLITIHEAVSARDVLALIRPPAKASTAAK